METFIGWLKQHGSLNETSTRYSVEVNFRTKIGDILENYAKIALGYVSAALKHSDHHVKQVFDDGLIRILVSARNWDDGEWIVVVSWNPHHQCFFITKGFYNKMNKQVSFKKDSAIKCDSDNPAEITAHVKNLMHHLKDQPDRHVLKLKKVPLKRGPKK
jgi:hypothetical protein